ncbi:MAG: helicase [Sulfurovum sp.]|nr:helicase [Sulfurovum sp.]
MSKKKRKHFIKLNNKIRELFASMPFDEGLATLSDDELLELVLLLELDTPSLNRDDSIRTLRRVWSEGDYGYRKAIVDHLSGKKILSKPKTKHSPSKPIDKVDKILELLHPLEHSRDEEHIILKSFMGLRAAKITAEKIESKLMYIRLRQRIDSLQDSLGVAFNTSSIMEFYWQYSFDFTNESFTKTLLTYSHELDITALLKQSDEQISEVLTSLKQTLIEKKIQEINEFIVFTREHRYMTEGEICHSMRQLPVEGDLYHSPIDYGIIEMILHAIDKDYYLIDSAEHFIVEKVRSATLFDVQVTYRLSVSYAKSYTYATIWKGENLPVQDDMQNKNETTISHFHSTVASLEEELRQMSEYLKVDQKTIQKYIKQFLEPQLASSGNLTIKEKSRRRILYHFSEYLKPLKEQHMREVLLAKTIRDFKQLFPLARSLKRKIIFHAGPTNSGKTYTAMQKLSASTTGYYLAPLRLLALEGYESLKERTVPCSLVTGEEEIIDEGSTHVSSTIEMLNPSIEVDVCVIDEIQMINDRDRGWAWANALIGVPAKEVILTGSENTISAVKQIAEYLGEELELVHFERKNPLEMMQKHTPIKHIEPKTAIVAFSRKEVLSYKQRLSSKYKVSVIYGNLSPEVRREEARKFREAESDILIATDAIAMGLNLPIKTLLFARGNKFDGLRRRELTTTEVLQISGRAGRYGIEEHGFVGALDTGTLQTISDRFHSSLPDIELPCSIMAGMDHVLLISEILETEDLLEILEFFVTNMEFDGPFVAANIDSMLEIATVVGEYDLSLKDKYHLSCAPVSIRSPYIESVFHRYLTLLEKEKEVSYIPPRDLPSYAHTNDELLNAEDRVKEVSLYLWLSFKFDLFKETTEAMEARIRLNRFIETSLQKGAFTKKCHKCGKILDFSYRYSICESCHNKGKRGGRAKIGTYKKKRRRQTT